MKKRFTITIECEFELPPSLCKLSPRDINNLLNKAHRNVITPISADSYSVIVPENRSAFDATGAVSTMYCSPTVLHINTLGKYIDYDGSVSSAWAIIYRLRHDDRYRNYINSLVSNIDEDEIDRAFYLAMLDENTSQKED